MKAVNVGKEKRGNERERRKKRDVRRGSTS